MVPVQTTPHPQTTTTSAGTLTMTTMDNLVHMRINTNAATVHPKGIINVSRTSPSPRWELLLVRLWVGLSGWLCLLRWLCFWGGDASGMRVLRQLPLVAMLVLTILLYLGLIRICIMGQRHPMDTSIITQIRVLIRLMSHSSTPTLRKNDLVFSLLLSYHTYLLIDYVPNARFKLYPAIPSTLHKEYLI